MDRESLVTEINQIIRECYDMAIQFKQIKEVKTETKKVKKTHIFDNFKYLNSQLLDINDPENYLIPDIMPKGEFIQLIASPKVGKTLLAYDLIASLILGEDFLGYELKEENKEVILIQLDESLNTLNGRIITRLGIDSCDHLRIVDKWKLTEDDMEDLEYCLDKVNLSLVVFFDHFKVNEHTLRKVLNELIKQGVLVRKGNGKTNPAIYNLKNKTELIGSSEDQERSSKDQVDQARIKYGSKVDQVMDQAETLPKSMDTEKFDPVSDQGTENALDLLDPTLDPLDPSLDPIIKALKQAHKDGYEFIDCTELSMVYLDNCDQIKLYNQLINLVADNICKVSDLDPDIFKLINP